MHILSRKFLVFIVILQLTFTSKIYGIINTISAETILQKIENTFTDLKVQDFEEIIEFYVTYTTSPGMPFSYPNENKICTKISTLFKTTKTENQLEDFIEQNIKKLTPRCIYNMYTYIMFSELPNFTRILNNIALEKINSLPLPVIDTIASQAFFTNHQPPLCDLIKIAFEKTDTPVQTIAKLHEIAHKAKISIPQDYNENALLQRALSNDTPIQVLDNLIKEYSAWGIAIPTTYSIELANKIKNFFNSPYPSITLAVLFMIAYYKHYFGSLPPNLPQLTQTQQHVISNNITFLHSDTLNAYIENQDYQDLVNNVMKKEQELAQLGYCTFVHGQKWKYQLIEEWYTKLWELKNKQLADDYLFIHCKKIDTDPLHLQQERSLRSYIIQNGRENETIRRKLLFMNYSFFGNENNPGSCTAHYLLQNMNIRKISISFKDVFSMFEYEKIYQKFRRELTTLQNEHEKLSTFGNLLVIGIPRSIVADCVYVACPGGYKYSIWINGIGTTDNVLTIIDTLRNNPSAMSESNMLEFCLALTDDMLTPSSGIKVYSYNCVDKQRFNEWQQKSNELLSKIKKEIKN